MSFDKNEIENKIEQIKQKYPGVDNDLSTHDGCYLFIPKIIEKYKKSNSDDWGFEDLTLLYNATKLDITTEEKIRRIRESHVSDKDELIKFLENLEQNNYSNDEGKYIGIYGASSSPFENPNVTKYIDNDFIKNFINLCISLLNENNVETAYSQCENVFKDRDGQVGSYSEILHCLKPTMFPTLNKPGIELYKSQGVEIFNEETKRNNKISNKQKYYIPGCRAIRKLYEDNGITIPNFRILDLIAIEDNNNKEDNTKKRDNNNKGEYMTNYPLNQILYGPPGTGKTYNTIVKAMSIIDGIEYECCETNQSDDEKINHKKPTLDEYIEWYKDNKHATISTINDEYVKALKKYDEKEELFNVRNQEDFDKYINKIQNTEKYKTNGKKSGNNTANFKTFTKAYLDFYADWENSLKAVSYKDLQTKFQEELEKKNNDKTKKIEFITFHQSYSYEEFVEGIKPEIDWSETEEKYEAETAKPKKGEDAKEKFNEIRYVGKWGIFRQICHRAEKHPQDNYVLIIDEINRGNISKIFGELITLIEEDKRAGADHELSVTLPYSGDKFTVPKNLYIIGTMNTSDRSIASVDIALRRRFKFKEMMPKSNVMDETITIENIEKYEGKVIKLQKLFEKLNQRICALLDRDHQIGHSYFIGVKDIEGLKNVWFDNVIPLLNEYFYGDWDKLQAILGDAKKENEEEAFIEKIEVAKNLFAKEPDDFDDACYYEFVKKEDFNNENFLTALKNAFNDIVTEKKPEESKTANKGHDE